MFANLLLPLQREYEASNWLISTIDIIKAFTSACSLLSKLRNFQPIEIQATVECFCGICIPFRRIGLPYIMRNGVCIYIIGRLSALLVLLARQCEGLDSGTSYSDRLPLFCAIL